MKKFLRFLIALIVIIVAAVLILGLVEPKHVTVQRNTFINAPKEAIFNEIVNYKNWHHWSPWYKMDSAGLQMTYTGIDGQPGSGYSWVGKKTGSGDMKDVSVNGTTMNYELNFIKPFEGHGTGFFKVEDGGKGMAKVTWSLTMHYNFPMNAMNAFVSADKFVGSDFEHGLADMKAYTEAMKAALPATAAITETSYPAHTFAGIRKMVAMADMSKFFMDSYTMLGKTLGNRIMGNAVGLYYTWDTTKHTSDCIAAFPVADSTKMVAGGIITHVPASKGYMMVHNGGYNSLANDHMALMKYVADKGKKQTLVLEEYVKGPGQDKDSTKWVTNIYYLVQ